MYVKKMYHLKPNILGKMWGGWHMEHMYTGSPCLMRIPLLRFSLLRLFETFQHYLAYANFGQKIAIDLGASQGFSQKIL